MRITIEKKTDQLNFEDFLGGVTQIVTITDVRAGTKEQQYDLAIEGDKRVWRPAVTMLKLMAAAWGDEAKDWIGRRAELFGDPTVMFGRDKVGGIRISRLSDLPDSKPFSVSLTETRGRRKMHTVDPLPDLDPTAARIAALKAEWKTATSERQAEIVAEVARLNAPAEQTAGEESARGVEG